MNKTILISQSKSPNKIQMHINDMFQMIFMFAYDATAYDTDATNLT